MKSVKEISRDIAFYSKGHTVASWIVCSASGGFAREIADGEALSRRERYALEVAGFDP